MVVVPLLLAPLLMAVATALERRIGPAVAGWVGAAPVIIVIALFAVSADLGPGAAALLAGGAAEHVVAQVAYAAAFALLVRRLGTVAGLGAGVGAFVVVSLALALLPQGQLPAAAAVVAGVVALLTARWLLPTVPRARAPRTAPRSQPDDPGGDPGVRGGHGVGPVIAVRGAVALVAVGVVVTVAHLVGPGAAGLVSAFPTFSTALAVLVARDRGVTGVAAVLTGTVRALPAYLVFCVIVWLAAPAMGIGAAVALGLTACLATSRLVLPGAGPSARLVRGSAAFTDDPAGTLHEQRLSVAIAVGRGARLRCRRVGWGSSGRGQPDRAVGSPPRHDGRRGSGQAIHRHCPARVGLAPDTATRAVVRAGCLRAPRDTVSDAAATARAGRAASGRSPRGARLCASRDMHISGGAPTRLIRASPR